MISVPLEFADTQDFKGNNATTIATTVDQRNDANVHKTGFHVLTHNNYKNAEIGGMVFQSWLTTENLAAGNLTVQLKTAATNNLNATGTVLATITYSNGDAFGRSSLKSVVLPPGTQRSKFLGAIVTTAGNVSAANLSIVLRPSKAEVID